MKHNILYPLLAMISYKNNTKVFRTLCFLAGSTPLTATAAFLHAFPSSTLLALRYNDDN